MATREEMIAEIERLEEVKALEAELGRRKAGPGQRSLDAGASVGTNLAKAGKTVWDNLARGLGKAAAGAITDVREQQFPELFPEKSPKSRLAAAIEKDVATKLPVNPQESYPEKLFRAGTEAVGGGLLFPPAMAKAPVASIAALMAGGAGAQAGGDFGAKMGEDNPQLRSSLQGAGALIGGIAGALPVGMIAGPRLSSANGRLNRATEGLGPDDFAKARENLQLFERTGAKTHTLPEAFEGRSSLLGLAEKVRGEKGGEALAGRTARRALDTQELGQKALNAIGPDVDANTVAARTVDAANNTRKFLNQTATNAMTKALAGKKLPQESVFKIYRELIKEARQSPNPSLRAEIVAVAKSLLDEDLNNAPITDLQTLSLRVKESKASPTNLAAAAGKKIDDRYLRDAIALAEKKLGDVSPVFKSANDQFAKFHQTVTDPTMAGPLERLADRNPLTANEATVSRLNPLFTGSSPDTVKNVLHQLSRNEPTLGAPVAPTSVLRAWAGNKLDRGSTNPGQTLRGLEGSPIEQRIAAAMAAGGKEAGPVLDPLRAADRLQNFKGLPGMAEPPENSNLSAAIRTNRWADFLVTDAARERINKEIAQSLMPTQANLDKLIELAKFDPNIRRMLIARGIAIPQLQQMQENE